MPLLVSSLNVVVTMDFVFSVGLGMSEATPSGGVILLAKSSHRVHLSEFSKEKLPASVSQVPGEVPPFPILHLFCFQICSHAV